MSKNLSAYTHILQIWSQDKRTASTMKQHWNPNLPLYVKKGENYKGIFEKWLNHSGRNQALNYRAFVVDLEKSECLMGSIEIQKEIKIGIL